MLDLMKENLAFTIVCGMFTCEVLFSLIYSSLLRRKISILESQLAVVSALPANPPVVSAPSSLNQSPLTNDQ
jgi:hypothetical protein